ncbi:aminoacyl-histidine dipeptidase [uncultured Eubacterium sp.]|uniref:aminoacyl-histidine dipeptidase n=1 Tax=uncultured Eubacterium sp. TaxID=165185 RepID=UPI0025EC648E|nr:aminoacyl-histidine dipeptidase [uncultured Eubacterium sp.]
MRIFENLEPKEVFYYFEDICSIPHGSGNTQNISDYCVNFAKEHGLKYRQEECGNAIIWKDATPGYEQADTVILQGHMDMVAVKDADCPLDLEKDGLIPEIDGAWIQAKGTSLGGDDGIAVAYALAILAADDIPHPALEAVFTVGEEVGLVGATALDASDLKGKILMNMDSEDDGIFLIGCAGAATVACCLPVKKETVSGQLYAWHIDGLMGGHSGMEISRERANANKIFGRFLAEYMEKTGFSIVSVKGGEKDNAIAKQCDVLLVVPEERTAFFEEAVEKFETMLKKEHHFTDPQMHIYVEKEGCGETEVLDRETAQNLMALLIHLPNGVQKRIPELPDSVQTSLNMGILAQTEEEISMTFSVRSSITSEKEWLMKQMQHLTESFGGYCRISGVYPAWEYQPDSRIRPLMIETYEEITGRKPETAAIHAGVECGIFCEKLPGLDCISYGPQMNDIHTTRERLNIESVKRNWELTLAVLQKLK